MQLFRYKENNITGKLNKKHEHTQSIMYQTPEENVQRKRHTYLVIFYWLLCILFIFLYIYFY